MKKLRTPFTLVLSTALVLGICAPCGADAPSREHQVVAAFIFNFTQFVEWPADAFAHNDSPFLLAVFGDDAFAGELEQIMAGKFADKHPIVIQRFASADNMGPCHLLFVPASQSGVVKSILQKVAKRPILTVGENDSFMPDGGGIRLFLEEGKMRFQLDPDVLEASSLKASAKLLKLARIYTR